MQALMFDPSMGQSLLDAALSPDFAQTLLGASRGLDQVEEIFAYQVDAAGGVHEVLAAGERRGIAERTGAYARRFHAMDPVLQAQSLRGKRSGAFSQQVRACHLPSGEYRELCFEQPGFVDKLSFTWGDASQRLLILSFYRGLHVQSDCPSPQLTALGQLAMVALHARVGASATLTRPEVDAEAVLLTRLQRSFPSLTERERLVIARSLLGDSAQDIGTALSISAATVHTYRLRAYQRFRFRRASDFLPGLLN
ncbi:helix-turn-helix transcriptional regulator [Comamonas sp. MYb396]|uniref:helix-turn-helix transcriptional regulator n=1 Tax=Comamonas sp. MYb396 TaxID=2745302 RepID=UPI0030A3AADA